MQEKSYKNSKVSLSEQIKSNLVCFRPVLRNGWIVKFSIYDSKYILVMVVSKYTGETQVRYFSGEMDAVYFINMVCQRDAKERNND